MAVATQETKKVYFEELGISKDHLLNFADAIFSIAITLLVLEIRFPELGPASPDADFIAGFASAVPALMSYAISFLVVGGYWVMVHRIFHYLDRIDRKVLGLTATLLFFVALMPFPTLVLGLHLGRTPAVVFYSLCIAVSSGILLLTWLVACREGLARGDVDDHFRRYLAASIGYTALVFTLSLLVALASPAWGMACWALILIKSPLMHRAFGVRPAPS